MRKRTGQKKREDQSLAKRKIKHIKQRRWKEGKSRSNTKGEMEERQQPSSWPEKGGREELGMKRTTAPIPGTFLYCCCYLGKDEPGFFWKCLMSNQHKYLPCYIL